MIKDERMKCICDAVTGGGIVCDVGTDHAFVPIELVSSGRSKGAVITDISLPSLEKGIENVRKNNLSHLIKSCHCSGTVSADLSGVTDIVIAGMGGELIASILDADPRIKNENINLVLQPMSRAEELRKYLYMNGFEIKSEMRVRSDGRLYTVISASFTEKNTECNLKNLYLGMNFGESELDKQYTQGVVKIFETKRRGLLDGGRVEEADGISAMIKEILS